SLEIDPEEVYLISNVLTVLILLILFFFFSSRRRHTRWPRDWSSDVCSSDLHYPWLEGVPSLGRPFLPSDYGAATGEIPIARVVFVECNCPPEEAGREVAFVERLAQGEPRLTGIVAFANLADSETIDRQLAA